MTNSTFLFVHLLPFLSLNTLFFSLFSISNPFLPKQKRTVECILLFYFNLHFLSYSFSFPIIFSSFLLIYAIFLYFHPSFFPFLTVFLYLLTITTSVHSILLLFLIHYFTPLYVSFFFIYFHLFFISSLPFLNLPFLFSLFKYLLFFFSLPSSFTRNSPLSSFLCFSLTFTIMRLFHYLLPPPVPFVDFRSKKKHNTSLISKCFVMQHSRSQLPSSSSSPSYSSTSCCCLRLFCCTLTCEQ